MNDTSNKIAQSDLLTKENSRKSANNQVASGGFHRPSVRVWYIATVMRYRRELGDLWSCPVIIMVPRRPVFLETSLEMEQACNSTVIWLDGSCERM